MKTLMLSILMLMSAPLLALDPCMTGSWYETDGEGINIEVLSPERTIGYWYGYGTKGNQRWYTMDFGADGSGTIYTTDIGRGLHEVGKASLDAIDSDTLLFVYNIIIDLDDLPWCIGCTGEAVNTRLTTVIECGDG